MAPANLTIGSAYYRITFADSGGTVPAVRPMIYVGVNIFPDDDPDSPLYYFQDTVSYQLLGSVASPKHDSSREDVEAEVFPHNEADLTGGIMTLEEVIAALTDALRRASWRH